MTLHNEKWVDKIEPLPAGHGLTPAQILERQTALNRRGRQIHEDFCKEFFLAGLSQDYCNRINNKGNLDTLDDVVNFLHTEQQNDAKNKATPQPALQAPAPVGGGP